MPMLDNSSGRMATTSRGWDFGRPGDPIDHYAGLESGQECGHASDLECLAKSHDVDVFLLAEAPVDLSLGLSKLNGLGQGYIKSQRLLNQKCGC
jgi:hypothetical protein